MYLLKFHALWVQLAMLPFPKMGRCADVNDVLPVPALTPYSPQSSPFWWASEHSCPLEKCILIFFLGWTEHLHSGNKQPIQSRQTEEIGEEVQDVVD